MLIESESFFFFLGKECFKKENFEDGKVYLPANSRFKLGDTTHFEIIATNCNMPGFEGLPQIIDEDITKVIKKLNGRKQVFLDKNFQIVLRDGANSKTVSSIDLSSLS